MDVLKGPRYLAAAILGLGFWPLDMLASETLSNALDLSTHPVGYFALALFGIAYVFVVLEEVLELRKSKPMMLAAALSLGVPRQYRCAFFTQFRTVLRNFRDQVPDSNLYPNDQ
ncbi:MAG: hypothetical protein FIA97_00870 [Methylococcaceae bacterium]|nr:hypothetical protein [Methylococcaceae bacterium]